MGVAVRLGLLDPTQDSLSYARLSSLPPRTQGATRRRARRKTAKTRRRHLFK